MTKKEIIDEIIENDELEKNNSNTDEIKETKNNIFDLLFIPLSFVYFEVFLHFASALDGEKLLCAILAAVATGLLCTALCTIGPNKKFNFWLGFVLLEASAIVFGINYFVESAFTSFISISDTISGTGGILSQYSSMILNVFKRGYGLIILLELPAIIYLILGFKFKKIEMKQCSVNRILALVLATAILDGGYLLIASSDKESIKKYTSDFSFDLSVRTFGLNPSFKADIFYYLFGNPFVVSFTDTEEIPDDIISDTDISTTEEESKAPTEYGFNELPFDYDAMSNSCEDPEVSEMFSYVSSQTPSQQNKYTGIFEGKNIIFITAESLTKEVIDKDRTPTLYRLMTKGIVFEDYYQPAWGGSTSTGEFSLMTGILPTDAVSSIRRVTDKNMALTLGNQFMNLGYKSLAFHNGTNTYYQRDITHEHLGYESFIAFGSGMENLYNSSMIRSSDEDMMKATFDTYADSQPFCIYYMSISGHCPYYPNALLAQKNWDKVKDMDASSYVKAYHAMNIDLENALSYLVERLEEKGMADDTVIVIGTDHYPYGLLPGEAWDIDKEHLSELYGVNYYDDFIRDHNALIIWSKSLEESEPIVVSEPTYSLDVVPTLSNLFGLPYDSRLMTGRDVFSNAEPLVIWPNKSWKTDKGTYSVYNNTFTPNNGITVPDEYVDRIKKIVNNKYKFASGLINTEFLNVVFGESQK